VIGKVLFVADGSVPPDAAATSAHGLLPRAAEVLILQVVPQLPYAWTAWPAFPDSGEDLARASLYVAEVGKDLEARGWHVSTKVYFSPLSAAEVDREILTLAETLRPDLICLAMERGRVRASIVREAAVPVLVTKSPSRGRDRTGLREKRKAQREPVAVHRGLLLKPAAALLFRRAGIL
jgi:nucleotide-binding universal stress UspA family protein